MKPFTFKIGNMRDSDRLPLLLKELYAELESEKDGWFVILVTDDTEFVDFLDRMKKLVYGNDSRFVGLHRCAQTLIEGDEIGITEQRVNTPVDDEDGIKNSSVVIVSWSQLPKELRKELKDRLNASWKNDTFIELHTEVPTHELADYELTREHVITHWDAEPGDVENEYKLLDMMDGGAFDSEVYRILKLFPNFKPRNPTTVLLDVRW